MVQKILDKLCERIEGCETLAFIDLSTRMVLLKNSASPESQDTLNALCQNAELMLQHGTTAMTGDADRLHLYLRAAKVPSDALCCVCSLDVDVTQLLGAAQVCLDEISDGGSDE